MTPPVHPPRRPPSPILIATVAVAVFGSVARPADASAQRIPANEFAVDAEVLGGTLSYAWGGADGTYWGVGAGIGGSLLSTMVLAGRHFSEEGWIAYEQRDGATEKLLIELLHVEAFRRWSPSLRQEYDVGVRASAFIHGDSSDDDFGGGLFVGGYTTAHWGWDHVKVGPRVLVGYFTEGSGTDRDGIRRHTREFGVFLSPLTGRISFGW